jgi:acetyl esterase/lipase
VEPDVVTRVEYRFGRFGTTPRALLLALSLRTVVRPIGGRWPLNPLGLQQFDLWDDVIITSVLRVPRGTRVEPVRLPQCRAEWVRASRVHTADHAMLYLHGGGFLCGSPRTHRGLVARLSAAADIPVLSVNYRHPPRVPILTAVDDCATAYRWLLEQGFSPERIVIAGDSAGGNLAFATPLHARALGLPRPAGVVALSPWLDLSLSGETYRTNARRDPFIPMHFLVRCARLLCDGRDPADPRFSPLFADLAGLPPVLLQVGSTEVFRSDSERMAFRLMRADVPCALQVWERQVHVFQAFAPMTRESRAAIREIGQFVRRVMAPAQSSGRLSA